MIKSPYPGWNRIRMSCIYVYCSIKIYYPDKCNVILNPGPSVKSVFYSRLQGTHKLAHILRK